MNAPQGPSRRQLPQQRRGLTAIDAITALIVILLVVQIWLLSAALDAFLAGHKETALPAAIVSGILCAGCFAMYGFVRRIDQSARPDR
jgi:predicted Co/Zn/Cd cation transporter (cation efflux family)